MFVRVVTLCYLILSLSCSSDNDSIIIENTEGISSAKNIDKLNFMDFFVPKNLDVNYKFMKYQNLDSVDCFYKKYLIGKSSLNEIHLYSENYDLKNNRMKETEMLIAKDACFLFSLTDFKYKENFSIVEGVLIPKDTRIYIQSDCTEVILSKINPLNKTRVDIKYQFTNMEKEQVLLFDSLLVESITFVGFKYINTYSQNEVGYKLTGRYKLDVKHTYAKDYGIVEKEQIGSKSFKIEKLIQLF